MDDDSIKKGSISYTNIKDISRYTEARTINVVGVISGVGEITSLRLRTGETKKKGLSPLLITQSCLVGCLSISAFGGLTPQTEIFRKASSLLFSI